MFVVVLGAVGPKVIGDMTWMPRQWWLLVVLGWLY